MVANRVSKGAITMDGISINFPTLVSLGSGLAVLVAAYKLLTAPAKEREQQSRDIAYLKQCVDEQSKQNKVILKTLNAMVNHEIDGNGIDRLKSVRDELQNSIIEK